VKHLRIQHSATGQPETITEYEDRVRQANRFAELLERGLIPLGDGDIAVRVRPTAVWVLPKGVG
jgi:hypothetical protein